VKNGALKVKNEKQKPLKTNAFYPTPFPFFAL